MKHTSHILPTIRCRSSITKQGNVFFYNIILIHPWFSQNHSIYKYGLTPESQVNIVKSQWTYIVDHCEACIACSGRSRLHVLTLTRVFAKGRRPVGTNASHAHQQISVFLLCDTCYFIFLFFIALYALVSFQFWYVMYLFNYKYIIIHLLQTPSPHK